MSRNGSGVYTLPAGNPVVTGTTIASTWANTTLSDIAATLTDSVAADGQTPMTGDLDLNANQIKNLANGTLPDDAVNVSQLTAASSTAVNITGGMINGTTIGATTPTTATFTTATVTKVEDAQGGVLAPISSVMRNRIINGAMVIDQRNAGASVATSAGTDVYTLDRWVAVYSETTKYTVQQNAGSVTPPIGFTNYAGITSTSAYSVLSNGYFAYVQRIEGYNVADLGWGTASAKTVTLSFWVRSSLTGTFGGSITNNAENRSYPFSYTISAANTWEQKSVTIAGDTTGTWLTTNGTGLKVWLGLGMGSTFSGTAGSWAGSALYSATGATSVVGTSGATLYITGVQLEKGSNATSFEYRQYGTELALCQRYYEKTYNIDVALGTVTTVGQLQFYLDQFTNLANRTSSVNWFFKVSKRATPTITTYSPAVGTINTVDSSTNAVAGSVSFTGINSTRISVTDTVATTAGSIAAHATASIEL